MRSMVLESYQDINLSALKEREVPISAPKSKEVLIRVLTSGVCRTDLHVIEGELEPFKLPIIPGHQVVGIIEKAGNEVKNLKIGQRVGVPWLAKTCGECIFCLNAKENLCQRSLYHGYHLNGGFSEYITADADYCYSIPDCYSHVEAAPLLCAGIIGYRSYKRSNPIKNGKLAIFGFGSSAHITLQIALKDGQEVFVSTRGENHQRLAKKLGASWTGGPMDIPPVPVQSAIVFAPAGEIVPIALKSLSPGGTVSLAGIHMSSIPSLNYKSDLFHEKCLCSVEANTREDGREFLEKAGRLRLEIETQLFSLPEANKALCLLKDGKITGSAVLSVNER